MEALANGRGGLKVEGEVSSYWSTAQVTELAQPVGENKQNKHVWHLVASVVQSKKPSTTKQKSLQRITEVVILPETENYAGVITGVVVVSAEAQIKLLYCR